MTPRSATPSRVATAVSNDSRPAGPPVAPNIAATTTWTRFISKLLNLFSQLHRTACRAMRSRFVADNLPCFLRFLLLPLACWLACLLASSHAASSANRRRKQRRGGVALENHSTPAKSLSSSTTKLFVAKYRIPRCDRKRRNRARIPCFFPFRLSGLYRASEFRRFQRSICEAIKREGAGIHWLLPYGNALG